ncbi:carbonyl reductase 1 [Fusarium mexicanum]|uniref:Carbonyl reductase 1 n=1 Tax=Fusarium mexicanum TaxID=751941 RepID=A0A8H5I780_9HYPO|nr:carbonyl reductase 1 [Fusarium mexicanum]
MAGRIASLERSLAEATTHGNLSCNSIEPRMIADEQDSPKDLLLNKGSTGQYLNEILVSRVVGEDESIATALETPQHEQNDLPSTPFDVMGIMSSPCYTQHPSAFHPGKATAIELWNIYLNNVEIILGMKLTHIPTDEVRVYSTIDDPVTAKPDDLAFCYSIYFAAAVSLEEPTSLFLDKTLELQRFKMGIEQVFSHGDFFNRPTLTGLRALAIYLLPLNINDADTFPEMEELPVERTEWTCMTFSLVNFDLAKAMEKLKPGNASAQILSKEWRKKVVQEVYTNTKARLEKCTPVTPHQRLTVHCTDYLLRKLDFVTNQQWLLSQKRGVDDSVLKEETLVAALDILEARTAGDDPFLAQFAWARKVHPQYHVTLYVLWYLCAKPQDLHVERAWRVIDSIFEQEMALDIIGCTGAKPAVLKALRTKAETLRKKAGCNTDPAMLTDMEHIEDPLKLIEGFNFDDEVFEDGHIFLCYAVVQAIATRLPSSTIVLGCRRKNAAQEAIESLIDIGIENKLGYVELDIENDASIEAAVVSLEREYGKLDVLINNAGKVERRSSNNLADIRAASNSCLNNLITSNAVVTHAFGKLLRRSAEPRVIMISSARGSMARTNNKELPPVANIDYCVSKVGLNMLMLHLQAAENHSEDEPKIKFWAVSPGHCKTAFNGYKGRKDPLEGAEAVVRLLESAKGDIEPGTFWDTSVFREGNSLATSSNHARALSVAPKPILISNAGVSPDVGAIFGFEEAEFRRGIELRVIGAFNTLQSFRPFLTSNAYVFNTSTGLVHLRPIAQDWAYTAVKAAVLKMFKYLQDDNPEWHVIQIQLGLVRVELNESFGIVSQDDPFLGAHFYVWLASPEAKVHKGKFVMSTSRRLGPMRLKTLLFSK